VTFVFNGGPGAASAYLHLGLAGPRIVDFGPEGRDGAAARLVDNPNTWLTFTDLVFIDPVGTGWSRPAKSDGGNAFWGVRRDAESVAKVIALYVARNSRSASPKYLLGESYGGFRAAKVARTLQSDQGIIVTGITMVSPMLEASFQWGRGRDALTAALQFPSIAATEIERRKQFTPEAMAEAERFALTEYLTTLAGPPPTGEKAQAFYGRIAQMTGLPVETVAKTRGYVRSAYAQHLRAQGQFVSSYDGTFAVPDPFPESEGSRGVDPVLDGFTRALAGAFVGYARDELGFRTDMTYILLSNDVGSHWDWGGGRERPGVSDDLRALLAIDPSFRLMVAHGRTDLVTPHGVTRYLLDQLPPMGAPDRVQLKTYRGGHMFYFDDESRRAFSAEAKGFYQREP
jgi:carboxypeptidase C (cathepsin A)